MEEFNIRLVSNVSGETFSQNKPSQFSTLLADEINLDGQGWEVAVNSIMYPSHVASTTENDYLFTYKSITKDRKLIPLNINDNRVMISKEYINVPKRLNGKIKDDSGESIADLVRIFNNTTFGEKDLYELEYKENHNKFVIHVYYENILAVFPSGFPDVLGFNYNMRSFQKGTYWAWKSFDKNKYDPRKLRWVKMIDLNYLRSKTIFLKQEVQSYEDHLASKSPTYSQYIEYALSGGENKVAKILFEPGEGKFTITSLPHKWRLGNNKFQRMVCISFDKDTQDLYDIPAFFYLPKTRTHDAVFHLSNFPLPSIDIINKAKALKLHELPKITIWTEEFVGYKELYTIDYRTEAKIPVASTKQYKRPNQLLPLLKSKSKEFGYQFTYDENEERFILKVGEDYFLKMSTSLKDILGFHTITEDMLHKETIEAADFPILDRAIHELYVYTNIVNDSYIGDVKAPILLSCPFKKDTAINSNVGFIEFLNPSYVPLNRTSFRQIDIAFYDGTGELVPFLFGRSVIVLHFRKKVMA